MEKKLNSIKNALNRLDIIQTKHIESFKSELIPDLEYQMTERDQELSNLKDKLNALFTDPEFNKDTDTNPLIYSFTEQIRILISQNLTLKTMVREHRDGLQNSMKRMSRGKQVVNSYSSSSSLTNKPRAINLTN